MQCTALFLGIVAVTMLVSWVAGRPTGGEFWIHAAALAVVVAVGRSSGRIPSAEARALLVASTAIGAMFFLYMSLGHAAFVAIPWDGDPWVREWDRLLFLGVEPVVVASDLLAARPWALEPLALFYVAFIPYLYVSLFLGLVGRSARVRSTFVLAFVILYGMSFMGYLFVPARGPVVEMTDVLLPPLEGGFFHGLVLNAIEAAGGPHGAFPSLHVGASLLVTLTDLRHGDPLRGLIYLPLVGMICLATVALRYHYVVDVFAGVLLAWTALHVAEVLMRRFASSPSGEMAS
jgi:hypothetical protein